MADWTKADDLLRSLGVRFGAPTIGQTLGGGHASDSEHYQARARDYGDANSDCAAIVRVFTPYANNSSYQVDELFYAPTNTFYKNGAAFTPSASLRSQHQNHVHVGLRFGAHLDPAVAGGGTATTTATTDNAAGGIGDSLTKLGSHSTLVAAVQVVAGLVLVLLGVGLATKGNDLGVPTA